MNHFSNNPWLNPPLCLSGCDNCSAENIQQQIRYECTYLNAANMPQQLVEEEALQENANDLVPTILEPTARRSKKYCKKNRAANDKIYTDGFTKIILRLAYHCDLEVPAGGKFMRKLSKENEHMSKKGILMRVEEWILINKALREKNYNLLKESRLKIEELERNEIDFQKLIYELREKNRELQERFDVCICNITETEIL